MAKKLKALEVRPREIYETVLKLRAQGLSPSVRLVRIALKMQKGRDGFDREGHPYRVAYLAAKKGEPYPLKRKRFTVK
jgi:hypothetical protein